jgi:hypothetical protein
MTGPIRTTWSSRRPTPTWGGASGHTYTFTRQPNGTTDIDVTVVREGKNLKGRFLGFVLRTIGRHVLENAFENSIKAIEARISAAREQTLASMSTFWSVPCSETLDQE